MPKQRVNSFHETFPGSCWGLRPHRPPVFFYVPPPQLSCEIDALGAGYSQLTLWDTSHDSIQPSSWVVSDGVDWLWRTTRRVWLWLHLMIFRDRKSHCDVAAALLWTAVTRDRRVAWIIQLAEAHGSWTQLTRPPAVWRHFAGIPGDSHGLTGIVGWVWRIIRRLVVDCDSDWQARTCHYFTRSAVRRRLYGLVTSPLSMVTISSQVRFYVGLGTPPVIGLAPHCPQ